MKVLFTVFVAGAICLGGSAHAQNPKPVQAQAHSSESLGPIGGGQWLLDALLTDITLTAEQQTKVDTIRVRARRQLVAMTPSGTPDSTAMHNMREVVMQVHDQIRLILTPDQRKLWDRNAAELRALLKPK